MRLSRYLKSVFFTSFFSSLKVASRIINPAFKQVTKYAGEAQQNQSDSDLNNDDHSREARPKRKIDLAKLLAEQIVECRVNTYASIPDFAEKATFGLRQSPYNRRSQVDAYCINTDQRAKPAVVDSTELSSQPKCNFFSKVWYMSFEATFEHAKKLPKNQIFQIAG